MEVKEGIMFGLGMQELIIILAILMFIFGAKRIPQLMEGVGKGLRSFKKGLSEKEESALTKTIEADPRKS